MANDWFTLPLDLPANNEVVWVRVKYYYGQPFLAKWSSAQEKFTSDINTIDYPAWSIARWKPQ